MKVGIITNAYEVPRLRSLVDYLGKKAEVRLYVEEDFLLDFHNLKFQENVFFTKGKGYVLLTIARLAEEYGRPRGVVVVNDARSVWIAMHRFMHFTIARNAGIRVPDFALGREAPLNFSKFIAKNIIDQNHLRDLDVLPFVGTSDRAVPYIRTGEEAGDDPIVKEFHLFQRFVESEYEYKVYGFGHRLFYYRQVPVLENPNKMETRVPIDEIPELRRMALLAMKATGLRVTSMDFLCMDGKFYLTDINAIPNFNYLPHGPKILGDYLLELADKDTPVGVSHFQAGPVGDIETNVSISPNRISDSMSGPDFSRGGVEK